MPAKQASGKTICLQQDSSNNLPDLQRVQDLWLLLQDAMPRWEVLDAERYECGISGCSQMVAPCILDYGNVLDVQNGMSRVLGELQYLINVKRLPTKTPIATCSGTRKLFESNQFRNASRGPLFLGNFCLLPLMGKPEVTDFRALDPVPPFDFISIAMACRKAKG